MNLEEIKNELENLDMNQLDLLIKYLKDKKLLNDYTAIFIDAVEAKFNDVLSVHTVIRLRSEKTDIIKMVLKDTYARTAMQHLLQHMVQS